MCLVQVEEEEKERRESEERNRTADGNWEKSEKGPKIIGVLAKFFATVPSFKR